MSATLTITCNINQGDTMTGNVKEVTKSIQLISQLPTSLSMDAVVEKIQEFAKEIAVDYNNAVQSRL